MRHIDKRDEQDTIERCMSREEIHRFVEQVVGEDLHAKRVLSLADGVVGVMHATSLSIHAIGKGLASANNNNTKHGIKQVDRLLSNAGLRLSEVFPWWIQFVIAEREQLVVALDWTEFDRDGHSTLAANLLTGHGRATPLMWTTAKQSEVTEGARNDLEDELLLALMDAIPSHKRVTIIADRGFGDVKLYEFLEREGWDYIIRFRDCIYVRKNEGQPAPAAQWLTRSGRARMIRDVKVTQQAHPLAAFVCVHAKAMKDPWCLATSRSDLNASQVIKLYGKRFTIEETFRDLKDPRYGFGLKATRIGAPQRRDRLILLFALAHALLTLLGAASEATGMDRLLKANTVKKRTMSLFRQGCHWFYAMPYMDDQRLRPLMQAFGDIVVRHAVFRQIFGVI